MRGSSVRAHNVGTGVPYGFAQGKLLPVRNRSSRGDEFHASRPYNQRNASVQQPPAPAWLQTKVSKLLKRESKADAPKNIGVVETGP